MSSEARKLWLPVNLNPTEPTCGECPTMMSESCALPRSAAPSAQAIRMQSDRRSARPVGGRSVAAPEPEEYPELGAGSLKVEQHVPERGVLHLELHDVSTGLRTGVA